MDVCCPAICPAFNPPFEMRVVIVKAGRLPRNVMEMTYGSMRVFAQVHAGNNPVKNTSVQEYNLGGGLNTWSRKDKEVVWWNEPVDLVIPPATQLITIEIYHARDFGGAELLGSARVPVKCVYSRPGTCHNCMVCGTYPCPWILHRAHLCPYTWPFIRGMPDGVTLFQKTSEKVVEELEDEREKVVALATEDPKMLEAARKESIQEDSVRNDDQEEEEAANKYEAYLQCSKNGSALKDMDPKWQDMESVVKAAVKNDPDALQYASYRLQHHPGIQRAALGIPKPLILPLSLHGEPAGNVQVYMILHHKWEKLPNMDMALLQTVEESDSDEEGHSNEESQPRGLLETMMPEALLPRQQRMQHGIACC